MPRTTCQICNHEKIVYRAWLTKALRMVAPLGTLSWFEIKPEVCQHCAETLLKGNKIFNLRRIHRQNLGTAHPVEREEL